MVLVSCKDGCRAFGVLGSTNEMADTGRRRAIDSVGDAGGDGVEAARKEEGGGLRRLDDAETEREAGLDEGPEGGGDEGDMLLRIEKGSGREVEERDNVAMGEV